MADPRQSADPIVKETVPAPQAIREEKPTPGDQERPLTAEEELDTAIDDTFPASDPIAPRRIDGPDN